MDQENSQENVSFAVPKQNRVKQLWETFQEQNVFSKISILFLAIITLVTPAIIAGRQIINSHASNGLPSTCIPIPAGLTQEQAQQLEQGGKVNWCGIQAQNASQLIPLIRYQNASLQKIRTTTTTSVDSGYVNKGIIGYLAARNNGNNALHILYECYIPSWNDYMPYGGTPGTDANGQYCDNPETRVVATMGYFSTQPTNQATIKVYMCFDNVHNSHYISTGPTCDGKQKAFTIGFLFTPSSNTTQYGFNITPWDQTSPGFNIATFEQNINELASRNVKWVRFGINADAVVAGGNAQSLTWRPTVLATYDTIISYAQNHGMNIFITTSVPSFAKSYSFTDYEAVTHLYFRGLVKRYKGKIAIWQIFNEANTQNYRDYSTLPGAPTPAYLSELNSLIGIAREEVKGQDANALITTNYGYAPLVEKSSDIQDMISFFSTLNSKMDVISLDLYPYNNDANIQIALSAIQQIKQHFTQPVDIAEVGFPTWNYFYSTPNDTLGQQSQFVFLPKTIQEFASAKPALLFTYEYEDRYSDTSDGTQSSFGIKKQDGTHKIAYDAVMQAMGFSPSPIISLTPIPTPTITPGGVGTISVPITSHPTGSMTQPQPTSSGPQPTFRVNPGNRPQSP